VAPNSADPSDAADPDPVREALGGQ